MHEFYLYVLFPHTVGVGNEINVSVNTTQREPSPPPDTPTSKDNILLMNIAVVVGVVVVTLIALTVIIVAILIGLAGSRRRRPTTSTKVDPVDVEQQTKEDHGNYDEIGRSFSAGIRSLGSSVASLTNGRYEVNQNYNYVPAVVRSYVCMYVCCLFVFIFIVVTVVKSCICMLFVYFLMLLWSQW